MKVLSPLGRFGPLPANHPAVTKPHICILCGRPFRRGDVLALIEKPDGDHDGLTREALIVHESHIDWEKQ